jgi:hypothetical protein
MDNALHAPRPVMSAVEDLAFNLTLAYLGSLTAIYEDGRYSWVIKGNQYCKDYIDE